jgi:UDP-GlcNAc3NAcA epimerase
MTSPRIVTVVGARPQFIKAAPVSHALKDAGVKEIMVHTGQHFDTMMSDVFFDELAIPQPAHRLEINSLGHGAMTGRMLEEIEKILLAEKPDWVLVYGDTNSTLAGALAASKLHIPIAHVEAGLRSFNRVMPEEINRVLTDHISTLLFCPTKAGADNLRKEGIVKGVSMVGDVMYDATITATERAKASSYILETLKLSASNYTVATVHRAENTDDFERLTAIIVYLRLLAQDRTVVFPVHPRTAKLIEARDIDMTGIKLCQPLGYLDMTTVLANAALIATDSGGIQKEAYFHRVPCITLRNETEWVETIECGWNKLWKTPSWAPRKEIDEYGKGDSAKRIVRAMMEHTEVARFI